MGPIEAQAPPPTRWSRPVLFAAGALSGAVVMLAVLAMGGALGGQGLGGTASASAGPASSGGALVTPPPVVAPASFTPTQLADGNALGRADAPVTVEVWADYQCPYCARFSAQVEPQIITTYVSTGTVRLVFRDLAFLGDESRWAAVAAQLAEQQDMFWPYHDYLFANQLGENVGSFDVERLEEMAGRIGLDRSAFDAGLQLDAARARFAQIQAASQADATALGITATPTVVVNGTKLDGNDWDTIRAAIDAAIAGS
jgi:protein-disulfide isomerase